MTLRACAALFRASRRSSSNATPRRAFGARVRCVARGESGLLLSPRASFASRAVVRAREARFDGLMGVRDDVTSIGRSGVRLEDADRASNVYLNASSMTREN